MGFDVIGQLLIRWAGHADSVEEKRKAYWVLEVKPEEKRSVRRPRRKWDDNIKWVLEIVWVGMD